MRSAAVGEPLEGVHHRWVIAGRREGVVRVTSRSASGELREAQNLLSARGLTGTTGSAGYGKQGELARFKAGLGFRDSNWLTATQAHSRAYLIVLDARAGPQL